MRKMTVSDQLINLIVYFEECNLTSVRTPAGWSIGFKHIDSTINAASKTNLHSAKNMLKKDLEYHAQRTESVVKKAGLLNITQGQFDALVDITWDLGINTVKDMLTKSIDLDDIRRAIVQLPESKARRKAEYELFNGNFVLPDKEKEEEKKEEAVEDKKVAEEKPVEENKEVKKASVKSTKKEDEEVVEEKKEVKKVAPKKSTTTKKENVVSKVKEAVTKKTAVKKTTKKKTEE